MLDASWENTHTDWVPIQVTVKDMIDFCHVIEEGNPIFFNKEAAAASGYKGCVVHPAYPTCFWKEFMLPWLEDFPTPIHSKQKVTFYETMLIEIIYYCQIKLKKIRNRGDKQFLVHEMTIKRDGIVIAVMETTLVLI